MTIERKTIKGQGPSIKVSCAECSETIGGAEYVLFYSPKIDRFILNESDDAAQTHNKKYFGRHFVTIYEFRP